MIPLVLPQSLLELREKIAPVPYCIRVIGEPGVGKSAFARDIHVHSGRSGAFIERSVTELPEALEQGELFGNAEGADTGARRARAGLAEAANRGTLFLDEIALASPSLQRTLLRLTDGHVITRLGETRTRTLDVRIIVATNEDLDAAVAGGSFRTDLLHRLGRLVVRIPPLRERRGAILPIARVLLAEEVATLGLTSPVTLSSEAASLLRQAPWPDNIRGLLNVLRFALTMMGPGSEITTAHLPEDIGGRIADGGLRRDPRDYSDEELRRALAEAGGVQCLAAERLGMSPRHFGRLLTDRYLRDPGAA